MSDHVGDLVLDDFDQVVEVSGLAGIAVGDEPAADGQRRGNGGFIQPRLDLALAAPGFGVSGAPRGADLTDHFVAPDALLPLGGDARGERFETVESGRDVVEEVGGEDFAAHDLIESAGDLLVHGDACGRLQHATGLLV